MILTAFLREDASIISIAAPTVTGDLEESVTSKFVSSTFTSSTLVGLKKGNAPCKVIFSLPTVTITSLKPLTPAVILEPSL